MKKTLLFLSVCFVSFTYAQNTLPTSGKVGIGTTSPSSDLEVKGETTIETLKARDTAVFEKPVIIKDSVKVESKMTVEQDVKIKGQTVFVDDAKARADFKILGKTKMKGDAFVEGTFKFKGLEDQSTTEDRFLMLKPNGKAVAMEKAGLNGVIYGPPALCIVDTNGEYFQPHWTTVGGTEPKAYIGAGCPISVGIGTNSPQAKLDVRGTLYNTGSVGIGTLPMNQVQLSIEPNSSNGTGVCVDMSNSSDYTYGLKVKVNNNNVKAIALNNDLTGDDVFRVMGNGNVWATEVRVRTTADFPDYVFSEDYELMSIEELEAYILSNNHLPSLPTAEEVSLEGMKLGELNRLLVEKVEELTLYTIEQQKQIEELTLKLLTLEQKLTK
ncbi:hypothetical protein [Parvicella tangerina]|uniref:Uncharacterized protein n=1 Tax=Parvicella tangerina TaxID=2829795 RepID=A0A916NB58_9FLAO|nr:hypothetical protein [Parvicella tangerina]CAG5082293.1 hypothetical protein CRYO30217_01868 [Parvicella tangerina]